VPRSKGQIRAGLRYAWSSPAIRQTLFLSSVVAVFGWNWQTLLPLYSSESLDGNAGQFGLLIGLLSIGAFVGALLTARMPHPTARSLMVACLVLSLSLALTSAAPGLAVAIVAVMLLGLAGTIVNISSQTRLQLMVSDEMSGRLMALYSMCWLGTRPLGGLIGGALTDTVGPRGAFLSSAVVIGAATLLLVLRAGRRAA
jgi:MFS family permease